MTNAFVSSPRFSLAMQAIVLAPWRSTRRGMQWCMGAILGLSVGISLAIAFWTHKTSAPSASVLAAIPAFSLAFFNAFVIAPTLLLAIDARQLRIPGMQRSAWLGVVFYLVVEIALPTALLGALRGDAATVAAILALGAVTGIAWGLLPRYFSAILGFGPMAFNALHASLDLPSPGQPGFVALMGVLALLGAIVAAVCWQRELHAASPYGQGMWRPLVTSFRYSVRTGWNGWSGFAGGTGDSMLMLRQRPDWMQPRADLHGTGPANPRKSLRIALGGMFMPQTWVSHLRTAVFIAVPSLAFVLLVGLTYQHNHHADTTQLFHWMLLSMLLWGGGFGGSMSALLALTQLRQRWSKTNGELPLLALLPGLGTVAGLRRHLLGASLMPPLTLAALLLTGVLALALYLGVGAMGLSALLLAMLGTIGFGIALTLCTLGQCMPSSWVQAPLFVLGFALLLTNMVLAMILGMHHDTDAPRWLINALGIGWSVLIVALLWLGRRGWRGYHEQPHPFLQR